MPQRRVITGRSQEPRQRFAEELRTLGTGSGASLRQLGERLGWDWSLFGKMEKGETLGGPEVVQALDTHYGTPGLLQTPGYAREVLAAGGLKEPELTQQVEARMGRRELLEGKDAPPFRTLLSEAVLREAAFWREQLEYLVDVGERPNVTIQVLRLGTGLHGLVSTDAMFLRLVEGRTVAYTENAYRGELIEENVTVERLQRAYDVVRDLALSPVESRKFILRMLEEVPCDPST
ncbi:helix-turn-helix domain-containing protein [Streptomyces sp. NPDC048340]|uniref:helix-turn-helix domain-containing protein n=1 Tax=Streptomyces sp. NPDC048340 TaxID=3365537 RepID=UPI00371868DE